MGLGPHLYMDFFPSSTQPFLEFKKEEHFDALLYIHSSIRIADCRALFRRELFCEQNTPLFHRTALNPFDRNKSE